MPDWSSVFPALRKISWRILYLYRTTDLISGDKDDAHPRPGMCECSPSARYAFRTRCLLQMLLLLMPISPCRSYRFILRSLRDIKQADIPLRVYSFTRSSFASYVPSLPRGTTRSPRSLLSVALLAIVPTPAPVQQQRTGRVRLAEICYLDDVRYALIFASEVSEPSSALVFKLTRTPQYHIAYRAFLIMTRRS